MKKKLLCVLYAFMFSACITACGVLDNSLTFEEKEGTVNVAQETKQDIVEEKDSTISEDDLLDETYETTVITDDSTNYDENVSVLPSEEDYTESSTFETVVTFRNESLLQQHYEKHGIEMGFESAEEYEYAAMCVVNNPAALHKIEAEDGDDVYYVEETNEFVIVSTDGYIRTYFYPSSGINYYNRQ